MDVCTCARSCYFVGTQLLTVFKFYVIAENILIFWSVRQCSIVQYSSVFPYFFFYYFLVVFT